VSAISNPKARNELIEWFANERMTINEDVIIGG